MRVLLVRSRINRNLIRHPLADWPFDTTRGAGSFFVFDNLVDCGVGHCLDLGVAGPDVCCPRACGGGRRSHVGCGCRSGEEVPLDSALVTS